MVGATVLVYSAYSGTNPMYERLADVLRYSARKHNPNARVLVERTNGADLTRYMGFGQKALDWYRAVRNAYEQSIKRLVLLDTDTLVVGPLSDAFATTFDVAVTERQGKVRYPVSSGAIYVRPSKATTQFFDRWMRITAKLAKDQSTKRFSDQIALRDMIGRTMIEVVRLDCADWNNEQNSWGRLGPSTRVLHITSHIRRVLFKDHEPIKGSENHIRIWQQYEREMKNGR